MLKLTFWGLFRRILNKKNDRGFSAAVARKIKNETYNLNNLINNPIIITLIKHAIIIHQKFCLETHLIGSLDLVSVCRATTWDNVCALLLVVPWTLQPTVARLPEWLAEVLSQHSLTLLLKNMGSIVKANESNRNRFVCFNSSRVRMCCWWARQPDTIVATRRSRTNQALNLIHEFISSFKCE